MATNETDFKTPEERDSESRSDPLDRLTMYAENAGAEEAEEILNEIDGLLAGDLEICTVREITTV